MTLALFLLAQAIPAGVAYVSEPGSARTCQVERVIDGDTFDACGQRIRVADIDTPELNARCSYEAALAIRARNRLAALLREPFVLVRSGRNRDRNGRLLRVVVRVRDGRSVGAVMVQERLARVWTGRREPWC